MIFHSYTFDMVHTDLIVFLYNFILYQKLEICIFFSSRCSQMALKGPYFLKILLGVSPLYHAGACTPRPLPQLARDHRNNLATICYGYLAFLLSALYNMM